MLVFKTSKANIENCSKLFIMLGLVFALILTDVLIEYKSVVKDEDLGFNASKSVVMDELLIPNTKVELELPKLQTPPPPEPIIEHIEVVSDDKLIQETIVYSTETTQSEAIIVKKIDYSQVKEEIVEEEVNEDVPFLAIEQVPIYPGCKGNKDELRKCMQEQVQQFVMSNFNAEIAQELGLEVGTNRIFVTFVIDKYGKTSNIQSRAPHKALQNEAERVIKSLPKMKPGEQRGKPVGVKYSLPIVFQIQ